MPFRLQVVDRRFAFLAIDPANTTAGAYLTDAPVVVSLALQTFHSVWHTADPIDAGGGSATRNHVPSAQQLAVLELLATGLTDDAIARRLGVSRRTIVRLVNDLQQQLAATGRFQLALLAHRAGWLDDPGRAPGAGRRGR